MMLTEINSDLQVKFAELWRIVGNSPMLAIHYKYKGECRTIYAKIEQFNITGSIKDRMALYILQQAYKNGNIKPEDTIVEATSGNTGIAFAAIGKALGHKVIIVMPDWMSKERKDIISSLGAEIIPVSKEEGGFLGSIRKTEEIALTRPNIFLPRQFSNHGNVEAHKATTGKEIWHQLQSVGLTPDAFVAGVGTGGTVMGVGDFLREMSPAIKIHPLEPEESPTLSTGYRVGSHRIQGISDEFIPAIVELEKLDEVINVHDGDSIIMAQMLASKLGLAVGISSGANFLGAVKVQNEMGGTKNVVTTFSDSNKKYLSTDLVRLEPMRNDYLCKDIELVNFNIIRRVCEVCLDNFLMTKRGL